MPPLSLLAAFVRRDWTIARSYRFAFALEWVDAIINLTMFFYIGRLVDGSGFSTGPNGRDSYFDFVIVGIVLVQVMTVGLWSFTAKLRRDQTTGTLEALLAAPASHAFVIIGTAAYDLVRATALAAATLLGGILLFGLDLHPSVDLVPALAIGFPLALVVFAAMGIAVAGATIVFKETAALVGFFTYGLSLLGGVYFPVRVLPGALEALARVSPFTWTVDLLRAAFLGNPVDWWKLGGLAGWAIILPPIALTIFRAALDRAKAAGTLAQY
jgi:ABC-2 type transport system permease protein